jgi:ABC-type antimicrobial peptide transport system permease subunit
MIKSYFKIAFRNLQNKIAFSFINITGLAIGMAGAILIFAWAQNEYSYDNFHANKNTLYRVWNRTMPPGDITCWDVTSGPMGKALKDGFPEIKSAARVYWETNRLFNYGDNSLKAKGNDVDKQFLTMFTYPLVQGSAAHALDDVNSLVITQRLAKKIFGNAEPMNKLVKINNKDVYKVTGVLKDLPNNTLFHFDYLVALNDKLYGDSWNSSDYNTYVQLQPNANINQLNAKIKGITMKYSPTSRQEVFLHPMSKWHLYSDFQNGQIVGGRIDVVHLLLGIAGIILLIACINFMNLSTAQSQKRAREVGVRKVIGASRISLITQFLSESVIIAFIAGIIALIMVALCLPAFNQFTQTNLSIGYANPTLWLAFIGFILFTGLLAGSYPAFLLSGFRPVKVLKGASLFTGATNWFNPRKVLVVLQFSVAVVLVVTTIVVYRQIKFAQSRDTGYNINNLVEVPVEGDIKKNYDVIKNELINSGAAIAMCRTSLDITVDGSGTGGLKWDGMSDDKKQMTFSQFGTSGDFISTTGMKMLEGRDIDFNAYPSDSAACMFNATAIKQMGIKDPIGKLIQMGSTSIKIVGVFNDFIINSPYYNVNPMIVLGSKTWSHNTIIRLNTQNTVSKNLQLIEAVFKKYNPAYPFTYKFADKEYQEKFSDEQQTGTLALIFAGLTIFISCLGLFGLASYMAENRSKEIGIRKVLGASVAGIAQMLTREFVTLVIIAIILATPVAWWAASKWLQGFTYRINIGWLTFVVAGSVAIVIAIITVSAQSIKAAMANPVNTIKTE